MTRSSSTTLGEHLVRRDRHDRAELELTRVERERDLRRQARSDRIEHNEPVSSIEHGSA
jgi:hypothetical protein